MKHLNQAITIVAIFALIYMWTLNPIGIDITEEYIGFIPVTVLFMFSIYAIKETRGTHKIIAYITLGISFAALTAQLNTLNIIIPDILTPSFTLGYLQALIVLISLITGFMVARG